MMNFKFCVALATTLAIGQSYAFDDLRPSVTCNTWNKDQWLGFLKKTSQSFPMLDYGELSRTFKKCSLKIQNLGLEKCSENFRKLVSAKDKVWEAGFGYDLSDAAYRQSQPDYAGIPDELKLGFPDDWKNIAKTNGWKYVSMTGTVTQHPTNIILIQNKNYNKWVRYDPDSGSGYGLLDVITIEKPDIQGKVADFYMQEYNYSSVKKTYIPSVAPSRCSKCHVNGLREITPSPGSVTSTSPSGDLAGEALIKKTLHDLNTEIKNDTVAQNFGGHYPHRKDLGPPMGDRQGCTSCHDGVDRNALNIGTELQQLYLKIVEQKTMPPASTLKGKVLSDQERMALYMNIVSSHVNEVKEWLFPAICDQQNMPKKLQEEQSIQIPEITHQ